MGIREIPKTQLGWLGQTQLVHMIKTDRLAEWQAGRQNTVLARGKNTSNITLPGFGSLPIIVYSLWGGSLCLPSRQTIVVILDLASLSPSQSNCIYMQAQHVIGVTAILSHGVNISPFCTSRSSTSSNSFSWTAGGKSSMSETKKPPKDECIISLLKLAIIFNWTDWKGQLENVSAVAHFNSSLRVLFFPQWPLAFTACSELFSTQ